MHDTGTAPHPTGARWPFRKAHGAGNDFVVLDDRADALELHDGLVQALCERRHGIGADGVIRLGAPRTADGDVFMDYRNADGEAVEMCGNGVRVVADQWLRHVDPGARSVAVDTRSGTKHVAVLDARDGEVDGDAPLAYRVDMGPPLLAPEDVPFRSALPLAVSETLHVRGRDGLDHQVAISAVGMGNPHAVLEVPDVAAAPVTSLGPLLEHHERFPQRANVSFAQVETDDHVALRVWERGVGETAACGTGACATVVALQRRGRVGERVTVSLPGGDLVIEHAPGGTVHLTGPAVEVATGTVALAALTGARHQPAAATGGVA